MISAEAMRFSCKVNTREPRGLIADIAVRVRVRGTEHPATLNATHALAVLYKEQGRLYEAESLARRLVKARRDRSESAPGGEADSLYLLAEIMIGGGDPEEAEPLLRECLQIRSASEAYNDRLIANTESLLGACLTALRRYEEAEPLLLGSYPRIESAEEEPDDLASAACQRIIDLYDAWGDAEKANAWRAKLLSPP